MHSILVSREGASIFPPRALCLLIPPLPYRGSQPRWVWGWMEGGADAKPGHCCCLHSCLFCAPNPLQPHLFSIA